MGTDEQRGIDAAVSGLVVKDGLTVRSELLASRMMEVLLGKLQPLAILPCNNRSNVRFSRCPRTDVA